MLGTLRFALSLLVTIAHLNFGSRWSFCTHHLGQFAVFGFYLISGYLMALILNDVYHFKFRSFLVNRLLRIFPAYYVVSAMVLLTILIFPESRSYHVAWNVQTRPSDLLGNLLIVPFEFYDHSFRLIPPTWSIAVELINYFLLWLFIARNRTTTIIALLLSITFHCLSILNGHASFETVYFPFYAAILPYSLGSGIYFLRDRFSSLTHICPYRLTLIVIIMWLLNMAMPVFYTSLLLLSFYLNLGIVAVLVFILARLQHDKFRIIDKFLGDISYPIFLLHYLVGFYVAIIFTPGKWRGIQLLVISTPIIIGMSAILAWFITIIEPLRDKFRPHTNYSSGV